MNISKHYVVLNGLNSKLDSIEYQHLLLDIKKKKYLHFIKHFTLTNLLILSAAKPDTSAIFIAFRGTVSIYIFVCKRYI